MLMKCFHEQLTIPNIHWCHSLQTRLLKCKHLGKPQNSKTAKPIDEIALQTPLVHKRSQQYPVTCLWYVSLCTAFIRESKPGLLQKHNHRQIFNPYNYYKHRIQIKNPIYWILNLITCSFSRKSHFSWLRFSFSLSFFISFHRYLMTLWSMLIFIEKNKLKD